ncbi:MAG: hypothetical protein COU10_01680 [Candidatus Harrisonbacteria bacterium CG10_big_fil_rev_8_21_14_0_10_45_28]|uniref:Uncharacterized protein n=1 Tax=Candidatus Harrisonbacteria bacterium CG10_big_fil_rev_8_21_14_0_10_45_28 TaxID=1974586 RepID=A0A2H0UNK0_9BACT|nr:MAG: hypothetical protein COU10_01680 [Candidatus Harrisonbacteria bacterium CG10_big_fil_rev_8_21_14_0_10_45_28]
MKKINYPQFIESLHSTAKKAEWKIFYEKESDSLYWTETPFPSHAKLAKVAKEIYFFLNNTGKVGGLMIQPFQNNFVSHNEEMEKIKEFFNQKTKDDVITMSMKRKEFDPMIATLTATIKKDIYKDASDAKYTVEDLSKFLVSSSK